MTHQLPTAGRNWLDRHRRLTAILVGIVGVAIAFVWILLP